MRIVKVRKDALKKCKEIHSLGYWPESCVIIDKDDNIIFGSSYIDFCPADYVYCVEWDCDRLVLEVCHHLEDSFADKQTKENKNYFFKDLNKYVRQNFSKDSQECLNIDTREYRCIRPDNYIEQPDINFHIHHKNGLKKEMARKEEEENRAKIPLF